jgi:hypothetical protein
MELPKAPLFVPCRLVESALEAENLEAGEQLYEQQIRLHEAYEPGSEHAAMLGYQLGTLQASW